MPTRCPNCNIGFDSYGRCPYCGHPLERVKSASPLLIGAIIVGVLALVSLSAFLAWRFLGDHMKDVVTRSRTQGAGGVQVPAPAFKVAQGSKPTFTVQELSELRSRFEQKQFDALTKTAGEIQETFERDPSYEYQVHDFYLVFEAPLPEYQALLDAWVEHHPSHFAPYLARAHYFVRTAWVKRGEGFAADTSDEQFQGMHHYFQKASADIDAALDINPRLLTAYIKRIAIHNANGEDRAEDAVFKKAKTFFPSSFLLYNTMLWAKLPRWGGSYPRMSLIAIEALGHVESNPELFMLFGEILADQAWARCKEKQYDKALELYTKAISYGEHYSFFEERGRTYYYLKNYEQALQDVDHSIALRPCIGSPYRLRASIYMGLEETDKAKQDIDFVNRQFPGDPDNEEWNEWAAKKLTSQGHAAFKADLEKAIGKYNAAIVLSPQHGEAYYWRGVAHNKLKRTDLACQDFTQAIKCNPRHFEAYRALDYALAPQQRWDEIIAYWDQFLALEPDKAEAYLERAGTYRHQGNLQAARADLERACALGNEKACQIQKQLQ